MAAMAIGLTHVLIHREAYVENVDTAIPLARIENGRISVVYGVPSGIHPLRSQRLFSLFHGHVE